MPADTRSNPGPSETDNTGTSTLQALASSLHIIDARLQSLEKTATPAASTGSVAATHGSGWQPVSAGRLILGQSAHGGRPEIAGGGGLFVVPKHSKTTSLDTDTPAVTGK